MPVWLTKFLDPLVAFGLIGQFLFMMRFVAQWVASEKAKRSTVPEIFWYFSVGGGFVLLIYAIMRHDVVFIIGQATGLFIYARNIFFIWRARIQHRASVPDAVFEELAQRATELNTRQKNGTPFSDAEHRAAVEALQALKAGPSIK